MNQDKNNNAGTYDLAVAGGGLAGLTAALLGVRAGKSVVLLEKAGALGGRGRTTREKGFFFNLGAHALYNDGPAAALFRELGIEYSSGRPDITGIRLRKNEINFPLPLGPLALLKVKTMGVAGKFELAGVMGKLEKADPAAWRGRSVAEWFAENIKHPAVADVVRILFCLTTYAGDVEELDMGLVLAQWRIGAGGVSYIDGGWGVLVEKCRAALEAAGGIIMTKASVRALEFEGDRQAITFGEGRRLYAGATILAQDPAGVHKLLGERSPLTHFLKTARPVRAAALDVGIREVAGGPPLGVLDMGRRLYGLCHTPTANLAPAGFQILHGLKYLKANEKGADYAGELETMLDVVRPGWRANLETKRFLPDMTVAHVLRRAGITLPGTRMVADRPVYACGDWVSEEGMLLDASLASVRQALDDYLSREGATAGAGVEEVRRSA